MPGTAIVGPIRTESAESVPPATEPLAGADFITQLLMTRPGLIDPPIPYLAALDDHPGGRQR